MCSAPLLCSGKEISALEGRLRAAEAAAADAERRAADGGGAGAVKAVERLSQLEEEQRGLQRELAAARTQVSGDGSVVRWVGGCLSSRKQSTPCLCLVVGRTACHAQHTPTYISTSQAGVKGRNILQHVDSYQLRQPQTLLVQAHCAALQYI